jgi:Fur family zinc uptake transcriptional regulator
MGCRHANNIQQALEQAARLCAERGVRLTEQRRRVLALVWRSDKPLGAYDILAAIQAEQPKAAPPTVYRALDFLLAQGLIHKLQSLHAYVGCVHPGEPHASQFLICTCCGDVTELEDASVARSLGKAAAASGFQAEQPMVELTGLCADCREDKP